MRTQYRRTGEQQHDHQNRKRSRRATRLSAGRAWRGDGRIGRGRVRLEASRLVGAVAERLVRPSVPPRFRFALAAAEAGPATVHVRDLEVPSGDANGAVLHHRQLVDATSSSGQVVMVFRFRGGTSAALVRRATVGRRRPEARRAHPLPGTARGPGRRAAAPGPSNSAASAFDFGCATRHPTARSAFWHPPECSVIELLSWWGRSSSSRPS